MFRRQCAVHACSSPGCVRNPTILHELFEQVPSQKPMQDIAAVNFCLIVLVMRGESIACCLIPPHSHVTMEEPAVLRWRQNLVASLIGDWGSDRNPHPHDCAGGCLQGVLQNMHAVCQRLGASLPSMPAGAYEHEVVRCAVETCEREVKGNLESPALRSVGSARDRAGSVLAGTKVPRGGGHDGG